MRTSARYVIAIIVGLLQTVVMSLVLVVPRRPFFFIITAIWLLLTFLIHWHIARVRKMWPKELLLALLSFLGYLGLMLLLESSAMRLVTVILSGLTAGFLSHKIIMMDNERFATSLTMKPSRRLTLALWTIAVLTCNIFLFSLTIFFAQIPGWVLSLTMGVIGGVAAVEVWRMYFAESGQRFLLWAMLIAVGIFECAWTLMMLPLGYFVLGLVLSWIWYLSVLFVRFHFGAQGIVWRRQGWFILFNLLLIFCLLTFFARWI